MIDQPSASEERHSCRWCLALVFMVVLFLSLAFLPRFASQGSAAATGAGAVDEVATPGDFGQIDQEEWKVKGEAWGVKTGGWGVKSGGWQKKNSGASIEPSR